MQMTNNKKSIYKFLKLYLQFCLLIINVHPALVL